MTNRRYKNSTKRPDRQGRVFLFMNLLCRNLSRRYRDYCQRRAFAYGVERKRKFIFPGGSDLAVTVHIGTRTEVNALANRDCCVGTVYTLIDIGRRGTFNARRFLIGECTELEPLVFFAICRELNRKSITTLDCVKIRTFQSFIPPYKPTASFWRANAGASPTRSILASFLTDAGVSPSAGIVVSTIVIL